MPLFHTGALGPKYQFVLLPLFTQPFKQVMDVVAVLMLFESRKSRYATDTVELDCGLMRHCCPATVERSLSGALVVPDKFKFRTTTHGVVVLNVVCADVVARSVKSKNVVVAELVSV